MISSIIGFILLVLAVAAVSLAAFSFTTGIILIAAVVTLVVMLIEIAHAGLRRARLRRV